VKRLFKSGAVAAAFVLGMTGVSAQTQEWTVVPEQSSVRIHVGKSGLFSVAGHTHEVTAPSLSGTVRFDAERVEGGVIDLSFSAAALKVTGEGEPADDVPKVQETMVSEKVLDVAKYPTIVFKSRQIAVRRRSPGLLELRVVGDLTLHGTTRSIEAPVNVKLASSTLTGSGTTSIKQTDFGIQPVTAGLGAVRVKDEVSVTFSFVARR